MQKDKSRFLVLDVTDVQRPNNQGHIVGVIATSCEAYIRTQRCRRLKVSKEGILFHDHRHIDSKRDAFREGQNSNLTID